MTIVFTVFLGLLARLPSDNVPYPLFAYAGLMAWTFFAGAVSSTGNSLVGNAPLITKVYFPRLIIPIASVVARLVDFAVAIVILVGLMFYFRISLSVNMLMAPPMIILLALIALACGLWTSALNVKYRDIGIALPMLIQVWMFVSPVVYPLSMIPPKFRLIYSLNPLVGIIDGFRSSLFGTTFNWTSLIMAAAVTAILLVYGAYAFQSREKTFADLI
jgi:lipopolysaccharide transport system permease protein